MLLISSIGSSAYIAHLFLHVDTLSISFLSILVALNLWSHNSNILSTPCPVLMFGLSFQAVFCLLVYLVMFLLKYPTLASSSLPQGRREIPNSSPLYPFCPTRSAPPNSFKKPLFITALNLLVNLGRTDMFIILHLCIQEHV